MRSVLLIEDDESMVELFKHHFKNEVGIDFTTAESYAQGVSLVAQKKFDIYILDINLSEFSGFDILKILQKEEAIVNRVIVMSATQDIVARVEAYNLGASNFISKPVNFDVLRAILRKNLRAIETIQSDQIVTPYFILDNTLFKCLLLKDGGQIDTPLTRIEFNILSSLARNINQVKRKEDLSFLGKDRNEPMSYKALEMHIGSLRKKLGEKIIQTVRGVGYYIPKP